MTNLLLTRRASEPEAIAFTSAQVQMDSLVGHFSREAANPITLASMTFASLAFQASRSGLLALNLFRNPWAQAAFSYAGALASEVTVFRAVGAYCNRPLLLRTNGPSPLQEIFDPKSWLGTALDLGMLKFAGQAGAGQNVILRHAFQDLALVSAHEMAGRAGGVNPESGSLLQQLLQAEIFNLQMMAGGALAHHLSGGRFMNFENNLALENRARLSKPFFPPPRGMPFLEPVTPTGFSHFEPLPFSEQSLAMTSAGEAPGALPSAREALQPHVGESPRAWAERLLHFSAEKPAEHSLSVAQLLHEHLSDATSKDYVLEAVRAMAELSAQSREGKSLLVRYYQVEGLAQPILLASLPTTFLPEAWSHTFAQAMAKDHFAKPQERGLAIEVGSGSAFISIVMAKLGMARRIVATDKNIHAPLIGRLNAALNGVNNIHFLVSDLLEGISLEAQADLIVGCLPQMVSASPSAPLDLRGLADYAEPQGLFEDRFGLGTNAKLIDQARLRLSTSGRLRLMMAQRPGLRTLESLFTSHGFAPHILSTNFIQQDPGTDFSRLAEVEEKTGFPFEFRTEAGEIISAQEALALPRDKIFHFLHLVEASPYRELMQRALEAAAHRLQRWAYTPDPGSEDPGLHALVTRELSRQWNIEIAPETIFLGPAHGALLEGLLRLSVSEGEPIGIAGDLSHSEIKSLYGLKNFHFTPLDSAIPKIREAIDAQKLPVVVLRLPRQILNDTQELDALIATATRKNTRLIFIESNPSLLHQGTPILLEALSEHPLALANIVILHPLSEQFDSHELPLSAAIIPDVHLREALTDYAHVTYSRVSTAVQKVYERLLVSLGPQVFFHENERGRLISSVSGVSGRLSNLAFEMDPFNILHTSPSTSHADPIDMSFGESEWDPSLDYSPAFLGALQKRDPGKIREAISRYLEESRHAAFGPDQILVGAGVHPLIVSAIRGIAHLHPQERVEVLLPAPSYEMFFPTVRAAGARLRVVPTHYRMRYLLTAELAADHAPPPGVLRVVLINVPTNPAGQFYRPEGLLALAQVLASQRAYILMDEVFGGINFDRRVRSLAAMEAFQKRHGQRHILFGGISKEAALGGIRFGFAATTNEALLQAMSENIFTPPDPIALGVASQALRQWREIQARHRAYLEPKALALEDFFFGRGFPIHRVEGGYSLFVDLRSLFETPLFIQGERVSSHNLADLLLKHAGIKIKSDRSGQMPGHYRFVFSIDRLDEAMQRLEAFFGSLSARRP